METKFLLSPGGITFLDAVPGFYPWSALQGVFPQEATCQVRLRLGADWRVIRCAGPQETLAVFAQIVRERGGRL